MILRDGVGKECHIQVNVLIYVAFPDSLVSESYIEIDGIIRAGNAFSFRPFELEA